MSVRPPVCIFLCDIVCYSISLYVFFPFVRPFERPSVRLVVLLSVRQFECKSLSLMHVFVSVIFLISNSKFLTSNFDIYSRVGMLAYESVRPMCARI